jgi:type IV pilus assembly protein PilY1
VIRAAAAAAGALTLLASASAAAQSADVRLIRPDVLLLLDTSGSMEWRNGVANSTCTGVDGGNCNLCSNGSPMCPTTVGGATACPAAEQRNRWMTAIEVLTGTIQNFSCVALQRSQNSIYTYDYLYPVAWHQPMSNGVPLWDPAAQQSTDGILDSYADRVRFGLMTFDNDYRTGLFATDGMFSYGADRQFLANGCTDAPTPVNIGSKRASTDGNVVDQVPGGLISVGAPNADAATMTAINTQIQQAIVGRPNPDPLLQVRGVRPFGGTPIAGMLEDALFYWTSHPDVVNGSDPYFACRARYNVLITDGQPNMDFRPSCEGGNGVCPYALPEQTALRMAMTGGGLPGAKTFVIAFNASDPGATTALAPIAVAGGTTNVLYATDRSGLRAAISSVLDTISSQTSTRTAPAFGGTASATSSNNTLYQIQSSFAVASGFPWQGVLERRRTTCAGTPPAPVDQPLDQAQDDFGVLLRSSQRSAHGWGQRRLWTWYPSGATRATLTQRLERQTTDPSRQDLSASTPASYLSSTNSTAQRDTLLAWLRGDPSDPYRVNNPLGDIFHSNPLVVPAPSTPLPDQTYSAFRQLQLNVGGWRTAMKTIGNREGMIYVGTNDGILHAFNIDTGEEAWGFVPPYLVPTVESMYPYTHQFGVDGSPVTRDVIFTRAPNSLGSATSWHTVLVVGLRDGGPAYEALDVTDPYNPQFMWQFTDANMRSAYGTPSIATIYTNWDPNLGTGSTTLERAVAILPGGSGTPVAPATCTTAAGARPALATSDTRLSISGTRGNVRSSVRCWQGTTGQYLYVVDLQTGRTVQSFGPTGSPIVGSPALWVGTPGAVSTRAYVGDADGDIWRLDMSDPSPSRWRFTIAADAFYDAGQMNGQPIVAPPVLSVDHNGDTLITLGSGDPDLLEGFDRNRVAVYREALATDTAGGVTAVTVSNVWEIRTGADRAAGDLFDGERLTGNISLFNGSLYFGTFVPANGTDACQLGYSRLWGVDQVEVAGTRPVARLDLDGDPATTTDIVRVTADINGNGTDNDDLNSVLFGVGIVRRPNCVQTSSTSDPYIGGTRDFVSNISGGDFRLVAQTGRGGVTSGGSRTTVVSRVIPPPITETHIDAWAVVFE